MRTPNHLVRNVTAVTAAAFVLGACGPKTGNTAPEHGIVYELSSRTLNPDQGTVCVTQNPCVNSNGRVCPVSSGNVCLESGVRVTEYDVSISRCTNGAEGPELATPDELKALAPEDVAGRVATAGSVTTEVDGQQVVEDCTAQVPVTQEVYEGLAVGDYF